MFIMGMMNYNHTYTGCTGLVWEVPGWNLIMDGCVYCDGYCDVQPWAGAAPYCSAYVNPVLHPFGVAKLQITNQGWGKCMNVTSAGWQVTLCDAIWHVTMSSRSG